MDSWARDQDRVDASVPDTGGAFVVVRGSGDPRNGVNREWIPGSLRTVRSTGWKGVSERTFLTSVPFPQCPVQACQRGNSQHLEHLLFYGAEPGAQNASGNTALHICALYNKVSLYRDLSISCSS